MARKTTHNIITSPELLKEVNYKNLRLLDEFLDYLKSVQRSEQTISQYKADIQIAFVWCLHYNDNKFFVDWTKRNIVSYQSWLINNNNNSPARVRRLKASLSSMANFIENVCDDEYPGFRNIIHKIESPTNRPVREKTVWADEDLEFLLSQLVAKKRYEQACFVALGMYGGRRKSEMLRFMVSDFSDDKLVCNGALYKSAPILTKGSKFMECYTLAKKFKPYFDMWMEKRKELGIESAWLFPSPGNPMEHRDSESINSWSASITNLAGKDFYPHSLRHYFVSALSRAGIPDNVVIQIIGWTSADMFNIYNDNSKDDQLSMYFSDGDIAVPDKKDFSDL